MSLSVYVIADIGACHEGRPELMARACAVAAECGVNALKFQWVSDPYRMAARRGDALKDGYDRIYARYLAWPVAQHERLAFLCQSYGMDYLCTAFLPQDVPVVASHVTRLKIASFEALDPVMWEACLESGLPVIVSLGMLSHDERQGVVDRCDVSPAHTLLHCVSQYPTPLASAQLARVSHYRRAVRLAQIGVSDHTPPDVTVTGAVSAAQGATVIEAHLRLHETDPQNPDYPHAMTPEQFTAYVQLIHETTVALGSDPEGAALPCEADMARYRVVPGRPDAHLGAVEAT